MQIKKKAITILMTVCLLLFMAPGIRVQAESAADAEGFVVDETGTLIEYVGAGGAITIPQSVSSIANGVFASNAAITSVTVPAYVTDIGAQAFYNCTSLTTVTIENGINKIPAQAFYNCTSLTSITIPDSVTGIGTEAFGGCASLTGITIPASVTSIGAEAFTGCGRLTSISVASGNGAYASDDGCLYNKAMTKFIRCPQGKSSVTVAGTTVTVASGAFTECIAVGSLTLPESVTTIEANAFSGSGISTILIPASVTSIAVQSGWNPSAISGYTGSQAQVYATGNGITFQSLGSVDIPDNSDNAGDGNGTQTPDGSDNAPDNGITNGVADGGTSNSGSGQTTTSDNHEKDETPKTGDGLNPVYFLCFGILLVGVYFMLAGKRKYVKR